MATNYKILGQSAPSASVASTLYAVPAATQAVVSTIFACNRDTVATTFRLAVRPSGASLQNSHYLFFDADIDANSTAAFTTGITLNSTDVVTIYSANASMTFSAFGSEITA